MAPTVPLDYTGQESKKLLKKVGLGDMMGKTRKISKGCSSGFVPDYRYAVETVAESEVLGRSVCGDAVVPNRKCISFNLDGFGRSVVPFQSLSLKMTSLERRDLEVRLKSELEQVRTLHRKLASFSLDGAVRPQTNDIHIYQTGVKKLAAAESLPMLTNDEPTTPLKKKGHFGRNGPRTKGGASAAKKTESVKQGLPQNTSSVLLMKQCKTLLNRLMVQPHAWIFNKPVDVVAHKVPDYYDIIKHPMDLGTVKSKFLSNQYSNPMELASDVRLTFKNAMTFNPPKHDVHVMAEMMSKYFEVRWKPIEKKLPPTADESTASKSSVVIEPERCAYVPSAKKQKTSCNEGRAKHERDKPAVSEVDKQKLGAELEELIAELPDNIINFLKESTMNGGEIIEDEIEIDIDSLSHDTLLTLRKLLDDFLLEKKRKQSTIEKFETEVQKESGNRDFPYPTCRDNERADEDLDIGGKDPHPMSSSPIRIYKDAAEQNSNCSGSRSSSSESGASSTDSENSYANVAAGGTNISVPEEVHGAADTREGSKGNDLHDRNNGDVSKKTEGYPMSSDEPNCLREGESGPPNRQVSPEKLYRAALLRSRFADIIIKAQENTGEKGEKPDPEKLKLEREELERRRREEKARLQAEAKAAEEARKKAEAEATAEARKKREQDREAARRALQQMEKTVDINENSRFMEDLEMFRAGPDEHLQSFIDEASPDISQNGFGSFKFPPNSNPLEQLGLYMKNDEEEEDVQPHGILQESNDTEEGEID